MSYYSPSVPLTAVRQSPGHTHALVSPARTPSRPSLSELTRQIRVQQDEIERLKAQYAEMMQYKQGEIARLERALYDRDAAQAAGMRRETTEALERVALLEEYLAGVPTADEHEGVLHDLDAALARNERLEARLRDKEVRGEGMS